MGRESDFSTVSACEKHPPVGEAVTWRLLLLFAG